MSKIWLVIKRYFLASHGGLGAERWSDNHSVPVDRIILGDTIPAMSKFSGYMAPTRGLRSQACFEWDKTRRDWRALPELARLWQYLNAWDDTFPGFFTGKIRFLGNGIGERRPLKPTVACPKQDLNLGRPERYFLISILIFSPEYEAWR